MVGFHVEFSQSMYSSKCPYSIAISCTRVTGPSVYWRSSWARALSEKEEAARPIDKIIVLIIFVSPVVIYFYSANTRINLTCPEYVDAKSKITPIHYYHDYSSVGARFCYSSGKHLRRRPGSMICAPSLEKRYYHRGAVGGCAKHADLAVGLRDVLDQPVDGVPAPLEPQS